MPYKYSLILVLVIGIFWQASALALNIDEPSGGEPFAFLSQGIAARSAGLAGAFTAVADDASAILYNPAGLGQLEKGEISLNFSRPYMDISGYTISSAIFAKPLTIGFGTLGTLAAGMVLMRIGDMQEATDEPTGRTFSPSETLIALAWGKGFGGNFEEGTPPKTYFGFNAKIYYSKLDNYSDSGYGMDIGFLRYFHPLFRLGFTAENLVSPNIALKQHGDNPLQQFRLGTTFGAFHGLLTSAELQVDLKGRLSGRFGGEFTIKDMFSLRGGYRSLTREPFAGLGIGLRMLRIDYSVSFPKQFGLSHRLGITYFM
jgi:hypothetical protein